MVTIQCGNRRFTEIKAAIFDKDGTLADSAAYLRKVGQQRARLIDARVPGLYSPLMGAFGFDTAGQLNPAGLLAIGSRQETAIAAAGHVAGTGLGWKAARELVQTAFDEADAGCCQTKAEATPMFSEARPFLKALDAAGVAIAIISADITANIDKFVAHYGLEAWVQVTRGADQAPAKPNPAALRSVCEQLGVIPEEALMFGDAPTDLSMAKGCNAAAIGVTWGWSGLTHIEGADVLLEDWSQISLG